MKNQIVQIRILDLSEMERGKNYVIFAATHIPYHIFSRPRGESYSLSN